MVLASAQSAAAAVGVVGTLLALVVGILLILAPIGIWNRLIKIHRDAQAAARRAEEAERRAESQRAQIIALLGAIYRGLADGGDSAQ